MKSLLAIGMVLLFIGMAFSPVTASVSEKTTLSQTEEQQVSEFVPELLTAIEKAKSLPQLIEIVNQFSNDWGRNPIITFLLQLLIDGIGFRNRFNEMRPLRRDALVISWGFSNKLNPLRENKFQLYRPLTLWYYSGPAKLLVNSRTVVIDFSPFMVKSLTGRQLGMMRNFAGLYWHRQSTLWDKSWTIMVGRAMTVRGFDLSVFNVLNQ